MGPPSTEQLIRDYLNRLSVAARGQLGPDDRRALVHRTRDFIDRKTGFAGPPTATEVARLLAGLGDPALLVSQERQRLATVRGERPEPDEGRRRVTRVLRRDAGKGRATSWQWPVQQGQSELRTSLIHGAGSAEPSASGQPETGIPAPQLPETERPESRQAKPAPPKPRRSEPGPREPGPRESGQTEPGPAAADPSAPVPKPRSPASRSPDSPAPESPAPGSDAPAEASSQPEPDQAAPGRPWWPFVVARDGTASGGSANGGNGNGSHGSATAVSSDSADPADSFGQAGEARQGAKRPGTAQQPTPRSVVMVVGARRAATGVVRWARPRPLEAAAVLVLGLGGAIYPPVWLIGVLLALLAARWNYRDRWIGLALPVVVTVIGAALGAAAAGHGSIGHSAHVAWTTAVILSRLTAVLGAAYLAWRTVHLRRPPDVPPWEKPHRVS
jgi:hypothetical protein